MGSSTERKRHRFGGSCSDIMETKSNIAAPSVAVGYVSSMYWLRIHVAVSWSSRCILWGDGSHPVTVQTDSSLADKALEDPQAVNLALLFSAYSVHQLGTGKSSHPPGVRDGFSGISPRGSSSKGSVYASKVGEQLKQNHAITSKKMATFCVCWTAMSYSPSPSS